MRLIRSALFVPGNSLKMLDKARGIPADALLIDLEDAVSSAGKAEARALVNASFDTPWPTDKAIFVRVNPLPSGIWQDDLAAILPRHPTGFVIPKVESGDQVRLVDTLIGELARDAGLDGSDVALMVMVESAMGVLKALEIATASPRLRALIFGSEDLSLDVGLRRTPEALELLYARSHIVLAAAATELQALDNVWTDIADLEGLRHDAMRGRTLGFSGKTLIHPSHVPVVNEAFSPSRGEIDRARRLVAAFESPGAQGVGAISFEGQMVDRPHLERARRLLESTPETA